MKKHICVFYFITLFVHNSFSQGSNDKEVVEVKQPQYIVEYKNEVIAENNYCYKDLAYGKMYFYYLKKGDFFNNHPNSELGEDEYSYYERILNKSNEDELIFVQNHFNDPTMFTTKNNTIYIDTILFQYLNSDAISVSRLLFTVKYGYIFSFVFYINCSKTKFNNVDFSQYSATDRNDLILNKNIRTLRENIMNGESDIPELNIWIQETDDFINDIEIVKK